MNLFSPLPEAGAAETVDLLLARPGLRIERIVSFGQASPPGFWYDQPEGEWVLLLKGAALLQFADEAEPRRLRPGDVVEIAPHRRHRVEWTDPEQPTVWLGRVLPLAARRPLSRRPRQTLSGDAGTPGTAPGVFLSR